ncbi:AraC family transcriptional regulator [Pseudomonas chlororaphis]|nr:helix-turn-helix transcriptional regulator [Pseudomonas chlororaphis]AZD55485.1 Transcriptional regulator, AraC family [Pseudomonas chlororaphis subsp. aurantiaca]
MNPQSMNSDIPGALARPLGALTGWQERRAKELMIRDMGNCIRISEVAERCNLSRSHFSRAFKKITGHSPQGWLMRIKIEKAKSLLITAMAITEVAHECGFNDHSHFTRTFNRLEGVTPRAWRSALDHAITNNGSLMPEIDQDISNRMILNHAPHSLQKAQAQELHP